MKFLVSVFLTALLGFTFGLYLPWWSVAAAGFIVSFFLYQKPILSFIAGFSGIFLLWGGLILFRSVSNDHILAHRISLFILKQDSPYLLILMSSILGGLISGMGSLCGSLLRSSGKAVI
ncbi:MAG: hypothetical protein ACRC2O_13620 [Chitinophagaceae bacterium]